MLSKLSNHSHARERHAAILVRAAQASFAAALFLSPLALQWVEVEQWVDSVFPGLHYFLFYPNDGLVLLTLSLWLASLFIAPHRMQWGPRFITLPLVGLLALSWIGVFTGIDPGITIYHAIRFTLYFLLYLFVVDEGISPLWIVVPLALGAMVQAAIGLAQFSAQGALGLTWLGELQSLDPGATGTSIVRVDSARILRAYALTAHPNILGGFIAFALILVFGYYLSAPLRDSRRYLLLLALALGSLGLLVSFSRAAALGLLLGAVFVATARMANPYARRARLMDIVLATIVICGALIVPVLSNRALLAQRLGGDNSFGDNPGEQRSIDEREVLIDSAIRLFNRYPLFGVGNGAQVAAMRRLDDQFPKQYDYQPAHLVLLDAAVELGILGGLLWLWLIVAPWLAFATMRVQVLQSPWLLATAATLLCLTVAGLFDYYPWLSEAGRLWQWTAFGLFAAAYQPLTERSVVRTSLKGDAASSAVSYNLPHG